MDTPDAGAYRRVRGVCGEETMSVAQIWAWAVVLTSSSLVAPAPMHLAGGNAAKEIAALEEDFETSPLEWTDAYAEFQPKYEQFAKKHRGTEQALTAKLRLLQFTGLLKKDERAMNAAAAKIVDEILAEYPRSEQLEKLPSVWYLFAKDKFNAILQALADPAEPDRVKAALLLHAGKFDEILEKFRDMPCRFSTYGAVADAKLHPHAADALAVGMPAPEILGQSIDGKPIKLSDFKSRVVVLDFFGDW